MKSSYCIILQFWIKIIWSIVSKSFERSVKAMCLKTFSFTYLIGYFFIKYVDILFYSREFPMLSWLLFLKIRDIWKYNTTIILAGRSMSTNKLKAKVIVRMRSDGYSVSTEHSPSITVDEIGKASSKNGPIIQVNRTR